jgi:putative endonuclease
MKTMYVYILKCSDNSYYTGVTNNLEARLSQHIDGYDPDCFTFSRRPLELVYYAQCNSPMQAILLEKKIKKWSRVKKEALINNNLDELNKLASCKNITTHKNYNPSLDSARDDILTRDDIPS